MFSQAFVCPLGFGGGSAYTGGLPRGSASGGWGSVSGGSAWGSASKEGLPRRLGGSSPRGKGGLHPVGLDRPPPRTRKVGGRHPTGMLSF